MTNRFCLLILVLLSTLSLSAQYTVSGGSGGVYEDEKNSSNGEVVYVLNSLINSTISYKTTGSSIVKFYKYTQSIADKQLIPQSDISEESTSNTTTYTIKNLEDSRGYFAEVNGKTTSVVWIIDYAMHYPQLKSISTLESDDKCTYLKLLIDKSDDLVLYTINGSARRLLRLYDIEYNNLVWSETNKNFEHKLELVDNVNIATEYVLDAPLTDTSFKLSGDQYAKFFGLDFSVTTSLYSAVAVEGHIVSQKITETQNNNQDVESEEIEAPVEFEFYGKGNDPIAYYYTWFIYKKTDPDNPIVRYTDRDIRFRFEESAEYVVKMEVADKTSQCVQTDSIEIQTSESLLKVPNILVLDGEHKFRVTYKSLSSFNCSIFNRWGNKIYEFSDPSQGWDGKYNGRYVTPGVYFYVIRAKGADGKNRNKAGDINVLRPR